MATAAATIAMTLLKADRQTGRPAQDDPPMVDRMVRVVRSRSGWPEPDANLSGSFSRTRRRKSGCRWLLSGNR